MSLEPSSVLRRCVFALLFTSSCLCGVAPLRQAEIELEADPVRIDFGTLSVGDRVSRSVALTAKGVGTVRLVEASFEGDAAFSSDFEPKELDADASAVFRLTYAPSVTGEARAIWRVLVGANAIEPVEVEVVGRAEEGCIDADRDWYGSGCPTGPDCDDTRADVNPGAAEQCGNGLDDDCDSATSDVCPPPCIDADGDRYGVDCVPGPDCDDERPSVNPGQPERCGNGLDDDCNSATTDACPVTCPSGDCGVGCADGTREGYLARNTHPLIAACAGGFQHPGIFFEEPPRCGRRAGDDGVNPTGEGCSAEDLCAVGWHVCRTATEVAAKSPDGCVGAQAMPNAFFATRQSGNGCTHCSVSSDPSHACGGDTCLSSCYPTSAQTNDVFGCGTVGGSVSASCAPLDRFGNNVCSALPAPWSCAGSSGTDEALLVVKPGPGAGGVLCCLD